MKKLKIAFKRFQINRGVKKHQKQLRKQVGFEQKIDERLADIHTTKAVLSGKHELSEMTELRELLGLDINVNVEIVCDEEEL